MPYLWDETLPNREMPRRLIKNFDISIKENGEWVKVYEVRDNHKRLVNLQIMHHCDCVRIDNIETWGKITSSNIFSFEVV